MYEFMEEYADHDEQGNPDELELEEVEYALSDLEKWMKTNEERMENGKKPLPRPSPDCPPMPKLNDTDTESIFNFIDTDGSGLLDEKEGFEALYCLVINGELTEDEAFAAGDLIGSFAGEDD